MTKIKINNQEFEFQLTYKRLKELCLKSGKDLNELEEFAKDFNNASLIASVGTGKTLEEIEELMDLDGTFECVVNILKAFSEEVIRYFTPNSQSQTN